MSSAVSSSSLVSPLSLELSLMVVVVVRSIWMNYLTPCSKACASRWAMVGGVLVPIGSKTQILKNDRIGEFWLLYVYKLNNRAPTDHRIYLDTQINAFNRSNIMCFDNVILDTNS